jgi:3-methyladenine DNA glycosylase/8-oxoguanine DNA glycosylase
MPLMFRLDKHVVLPVRDFAAGKGFAPTLGLEESVKPKELAAFDERRRLYGSVASWYMWHAVELHA